MPAREKGDAERELRRSEDRDRGGLGFLSAGMGERGGTMGIWWCDWKSGLGDSRPVGGRIGDEGGRIGDEGELFSCGFSSFFSS
jgi:hypothetical protein